MYVRLAIIPLCLCLGMFPMSTSAYELSNQLVASNGMSLDAAVRKVKQQTNGRILSAETVTRDGKKIHRIKVLLPDGTVRVMTFNAG